MSNEIKYFEGNELAQVGYVYEKKTGLDAGSRFLVIYLQKSTDLITKEIRGIAHLSGNRQLNAKIIENRDFKLVGKLSFEELKL